MTKTDLLKKIDTDNVCLFSGKIIILPLYFGRLETYFYVYKFCNDKLCKGRELY